MAYMLFTGEILETLRNLNVPGAEPLIDRLHRITDETEWDDTLEEET